MTAHLNTRQTQQRSATRINNGANIHLGLAWLGLAWLGLAWLGLAWQQSVGEISSAFVIPRQRNQPCPQ
jgi:hypothetical protein